MDSEGIIKGLYEISRIVTSKLGFEQAKDHLDTIACVIALLKEQDAVEPNDSYFDVYKSAKLFHCGNCHEFIVENQKYCQNCGRAVKWNA